MAHPLKQNGGTLKITAVRIIQGGSPLPEPGFWPAWWPGMAIREIGWSIVVVETDEGLTGFGPGSARSDAGRWSAESFLHEKVLGADPSNIGALVGAPEYLRQQRPPPLFIEHALWDLLGKAAGLPVYKLLGGYRSAVPAYCSMGSILSPEEHVARHAGRSRHRRCGLRSPRPLQGGHSLLQRPQRGVAPAGVGMRRALRFHEEGVEQLSPKAGQLEAGRHVQRQPQGPGLGIRFLSCVEGKGFQFVHRSPHAWVNARPRSRITRDHGSRARSRIARCQFVAQRPVLFAPDGVAPGE